MQGEERRARIRRLALASIAGQLVWVVFVVVASLIEPGYSETRDAVSLLGAQTAAHPWTFDLAVAVWGAAFIAAAYALALDGPGGLRGYLGPALIATCGLAQILVGFPFPADCQTTIDPACHARDLAGTLSWRHYAHGWTYFVGSASLMLSVFAMAWRFHGDRRWWRADLLSLAAGLIGLAIWTALFFATDSSDLDANYGLQQRLTLGAAAFWVGALAIGLLVVDREPAPKAAEAAS